MATQKSTPSAGSSAEAIDVEDTEESNIKIIAYNNGTSKDAKNESDTETEGESDNKVEKGAIVGDKNEGQGSDKSISHPAKANGIRDSPPYKRKKRIKLEEVLNFDILLPNDRNNNGVREAKKEFYNGFVSYRKLVDRLRPVFMERNTPEHKTKISQWLVGKIMERGGRFLKEDGDGSAGNCKAMSLKESLQYTIYAFEDEQKWPDIQAFLRGGVPMPPLAGGVPMPPLAAMSSQGMLRNPLVITQLPETMLGPSSTQDISSLGQEALAGAKRAISEQFKNPHASDEPPQKKIKMKMPFFRNADQKQNALKKLLHETENQESPVPLQKILHERQLIRTELTENQEILLMRQERLSRLEGEFVMFQDRQTIFPSERWLAEKIVRQEEIFENRELLGIQHQRCRRLQTLLELNERQMFEQQSILGRERLKHEAVNIPKSGVENGKSTTKEDTGQEEKGPEATEKESARADTRAVIEAEIKKQHQETAARLRQQQLAMEQANLKKRAALEQRSSIELALEQKIAMEHEIQYRLAMEHAMKRQQAMQHAMDVQKRMLRRGEIAQATTEAALLEAASLGSASLQSKRSSISKEPTPDAPESMGAGTKQTTIEAREAGGQQTNTGSVSTEEKYNGDDTAVAAEEYDYDDDDEYSIVI